LSTRSSRAVVPCRAALSTSTLTRVARLIRTHRKTLGSRWRKVIALRRENLTLPSVAEDNGKQFGEFHLRRAEPHAIARYNDDRPTGTIDVASSTVPRRPTA
jgi:hypothetical protein